MRIEPGDLKRRLVLHRQGAGFIMSFTPMKQTENCKCSVYGTYRCTGNIYVYSIQFCQFQFHVYFHSYCLCGASVYGPHIMLFTGKACHQSFILYCDLFKLSLRVVICKM